MKFGMEFLGRWTLILFMLGVAAPAVQAQQTGPATSAVVAALKGDERQFLLKDVLKIFYGDFSGDGQDDALAFAYHGYDGGNGVGLVVLVLQRTEKGFRVIQRPKIFGQEPRDVKFSKGVITVTTTVPGPKDPRCCPSRKKTWKIKT